MVLGRNDVAILVKSTWNLQAAFIPGVFCQCGTVKYRHVLALAAQAVTLPKAAIKQQCAPWPGTVLQVNGDSHAVEAVFQAHAGAINCLAIRDGFAVTASDDRFMRVWPLDFSEFLLEVSCGDVTEMNRVCLVLFDLGNRILGPVMDRILIAVMGVP
jgi:hypothetical protein